VKTKKVIITFLLVKKAEEKSNKEIEKEILKTLSKEPPRIPWVAEVERVRVIED
jgi:hypothetical protein